MLETHPGRMSRKQLEQIRGFLQYVAQAYSLFSLYLIGFHMTIDEFWKGMDANGWQIAESLRREERKDDKEWDGAEVGPEPVPEWVAAVPCFREDIQALRQLMKGDKPPVKGVQGTKTA
jgi:hypothetical protein